MPDSRSIFGPESDDEPTFSSSSSSFSYTEFTQEVVREDEIPEPFRSMVDKMVRKAGKGQPIPSGLSQKAADEIAFMERLTMIVEAVRMAEVNGQYDMARPFLSVRFLRRWQPWAAGLAQSRKGRPVNVTRLISRAGMQTDAAYDRLMLRITESEAGSAQPPVVTLWTFLRSATGRAQTATASFASVCTNCGAPVDATNQSACRYCGAGVAVLGPEWILDDIAVDSNTSAAA